MPMDQLVDGIEAINAKMLHRDLKPDNILIGADGLKIGDFGLSKIVGAATRSRTFKGGQHILYMAPEGWKQETNQIQIDMYSMGIIFFEIASLAFPYDYPIAFCSSFSASSSSRASFSALSLWYAVVTSLSRSSTRGEEVLACDGVGSQFLVRASLTSSQVLKRSEAFTKNWEPMP